MRKIKITIPWLAALAIPLFYLFAYTPYGMDTTDFGYFYGYAWRILQGQVPYRDFSYIKPALPLYWHALGMWLTPPNWQVLAAKAGFMLSILASAWCGSLYLAKNFNFSKFGLSLPILATGGFVFGIHSFPHMPWHTADGILFSSISLLLASAGFLMISGLFSACAMLCKQSFLLVPPAILSMIWIVRGGRQSLRFAFGWLGCLALGYAWLYFNGAWENFRAMTTGQLDPREALDAGILIYLRQNWILPLLAMLPCAYARLCKKNLPGWLLPCYCYMALLCLWYVADVARQKCWIGYGTSWPTFFVLLGGLCLLMPKTFLTPWWKKEQNRLLGPSMVLGAALIVSWSTAISGGYKIPAFFAAPLLFSFFAIHRKMGGNVKCLAWLTLAAGLIMFGSGYQYPYVFPARPLEKSWLTMDAGEIYPKASGVFVDADMLARLKELKELRAKYGSNYKTLPGFSLSYYLNGDYPAYGSDWLIDWEINGEVDRLYQELLDKRLTVFMERDQLDTAKADAYDRAGYGVPQKVRKLWRIVEETPHFVVFQPPE